MYFKNKRRQCGIHFSHCFIRFVLQAPKPSADGTGVALWNLSAAHICPEVFATSGHVNSYSEAKELLKPDSKHCSHAAVTQKRTSN